MFCTNCGAQTLDTDRFCPGCGAPMKYAKTSAPEPPSWDARQESGVIAAPTQWRDEGYPTYARRKKKNRGGVRLIVLLLIFVALALVIFAGSRGYLGELPQLDCGGAAVSAADQVTTAATTTTPVSHTVVSPTATNMTNATTTRTTTSTTVNQQKLDAEEIRGMLLSRKWKTTLEGYEATVTFKKDGTAVVAVEVKVFLFTTTKEIEATYSINDKCHAVIIAEYAGDDYGITGTISKVSDTELLVTRDKNLGTVTLKAA